MSRQESWFPINQSSINYDKDNNSDNDGCGNNDDNNVKEYINNDNNDW